MGLGDGFFRCRWVLDRLPLLAGGDLTVTDRRKVERHLIACPGCRSHNASMASALGALRSAATESPVETDAPSLWPALARQIRETRHESRPSILSLPLPLAEPGSWLDAAWASVRPSRVRPWLTAAAGLAVLGLTAAGVDAWVRLRIRAARAEIAAAALPLKPAAGFIPTIDPIGPSSSGVSIAQVQADASEPTPERSTGARVDYDLDHGTPMGTDPRDVKASY